MKSCEQRGALIVEDGNEKDVLVTGRFMLGENQVKVSDYLHAVAKKLNGMEPFSDAMSDYLKQVEDKVAEQATAEKFLEDVEF